MSMLKKFLPSLFAAAVAAGVASPAMANLVTNGGFESGSVGWNASMGVGNSSQYAHSGTNYMMTGCVGHGCVTTLGQGAYFGQTLSTTSGASYDLSFWVGENGQPTSEFTVFWNGVLIADVLNPANNTLPTPVGSGMVEYTYTGLAATGASTYFEIHGRQDPAVIYFDDVSVNPSNGNTVPEPGSLALAGLSLLALASARRAQKRG